MKTRVVFLSIFVLLSCQACCLYPIRYDGPYHGKVVDELTREPIEGAVVLGSWWVYHFDVGGGHSTYHDARETVTDKNGEFTIKGEGFRVFSSLKPMDMIIYKAGYTYFQCGWEALKTDVYSVKVVKWDDETPSIPLRKLTDEERNRDMDGHFVASCGSVPCHRMKIEINREHLFRSWPQL